MTINQQNIIEKLSELLELSELEKIRQAIKSIKDIKPDKIGLPHTDTNSEAIDFNSKYLLRELEQILETQTIERTKYYIKRLIKSLTEIKSNKLNDLNLNRWKEYEDIITDSIWILDTRDNSGAHNAGYWGNFIP